MKSLGIYIHIPFCIRKCEYCDFLSFSADEDARARYVKGLVCEIETEAEKYRNYVLYADKNDFELDEDCFFIADLIGIEVFDNDTGEFYGVISDVLQNGAKDVFVIKNDKQKKEYLLPYLDETVISIDINNKKMLVKPLLGLFD